ncbi:MAG: CocE/NonD family hydrolase [Dehalococcoidia bacterium]|nr:CocE/NonD family hydrolase [Dehalococcoidia bacterium]
MSKSIKQGFLVDISWGITRLREDFFVKHFRLPFMSIPTSTPNTYEKVKVTKNVAAPMRDGIKLYADIYRPDTDDAVSFPVVLTRLPYGKDEPYCAMVTQGKYWAKKGYVFVAQDVRGKYASEGTFEPIVNEANDGYDTLNWIASQPWCDGNIGMTGESYYGYTQWAVASLNHPNLKCIAPGITSADIFGVISFNNNVFCMQQKAGWAYQMNARKMNNPLKLDPWHLPLISMDDDAGIRCEFYKNYIRHPSRDSYWEPVNFYGKHSQVRIPVYHWGGWYDVFVAGTIKDWIAVKENSDSAEARKNQWLLIAPIDHELTPMETHRIGKIDIGKEAWTYDRIQRFFDYWLKGIDNGFAKTPRVEIFTIGDNKWRYEDTWPLARTKYTNYYFHSKGHANTLYGDGLLDRRKPGNSPADNYVYDPNDPVTITLGIDLWSMAKELKDRTSVEKRKDVLVYTLPKLDKELEITGPINVTLFAASSARDTDFTATLVDAFPDGYAHMIQEGIVRARYRNSDSEASLIEPGKIYEYTIDLWATSYVIKQGHRIRVEISSSNFNRWDRNLNTGNEFGMDDKVVKATQTIYHDKKHPSHITLPIIPR